LFLSDAQQLFDQYSADSKQESHRYLRVMAFGSVDQTVTADAPIFVAEVPIEAELIIEDWLVPIEVEVPETAADVHAAPSATTIVGGGDEPLVTDIEVLLVQADDAVPTNADDEVPPAVVDSTLMTDLQFVGLYGSSNGRSCDRHSCCGEHVRVGDLVRLVKTVVTINISGTQPYEEAVKIVKIEDCVESCTVGFIPRNHMKLHKVIQNIDEFCIVSELYKVSSNNYKRMTSHRNLGMAGINFVNGIPRDE
jgi:hypothetical protein